MIKRFSLAIMVALFAISLSCDKVDDSSSDSSSGSSSQSDYKCGTYNSHQLWTGSKGGCYYYNSNNNKTYVDRSNCKCK